MAETNAAGVPVWRQFQDRCVHFAGLMERQGTGAAGFPNWVPRTTCEAGVVFADVTAPERSGLSRLPCFVESGQVSCPSRRLLTDREAQEKQLAAEERFADFWVKVDRGLCPQCNQAITLRQVGPCVYGSCGHRLYQGKVRRKTHAEAGE